MKPIKVLAFATAAVLLVAIAVETEAAQGQPWYKNIRMPNIRMPGKRSRPNAQPNSMDNPGGSLPRRNSFSAPGQDEPGLLGALPHGKTNPHFMPRGNSRNGGSFRKSNSMPASDGKVKRMAQDYETSHNLQQGAQRNGGRPPRPQGRRTQGNQDPM